jgi:two-component system phosphate regulon sensor histidine kinase PhoR
MGFAQWFWRLFLVYAGLIVAHVLVVTGILAFVNLPASYRGVLLWGFAAATITLGGLATWYCVRRIVEPLTQLSEYANAISTGTHPPAGALEAADELGVLASAFSSLERDRARRLAEIEQNHQQLQTILGAMTEGVLAVGPDKSILLANDAGRQLLEFTLPKPVGRPLLEATRVRPVIEAVTRALASPETVTTEFDAPGLQRRTLSLRATRLPGEPCPGVMVVLHDLSELRRLENLRHELVANVSHELKTPLAAIKAYAETLRLGAINDPDNNIAFVRRIEEQSDRLLELILDILQVARLEQGQETFEIESVPLFDVIEHCVQQFVDVASAKQVILRVAALDESLAVLADEEGLHTILSNLIDNAIKYTPAGGQVDVRLQADERNVTIEVADTGIGIAEKDQSRVFERFYRVDRARSRELGGTGLGLSIVKHLTQAFGGSVGLVSSPGEGSTFRVQLRRAKDVG